MSVFGEDMKSMLGGMYQDYTEPAPQAMPALEVKAKPVEPPKAAPKAVEKPAEAAMECIPVPVKQRDWVDKAIDILKWLIVCGSISMLLWWFWQNDLMAMEAAYPCILGCGVIGAFGAGMNINK